MGLMGCKGLAAFHRASPKVQSVFSHYEVKGQKEQVPEISLSDITAAAQRYY